jgi:hypothetical protein
MPVTTLTVAVVTILRRFRTAGASSASVSPRDSRPASGSRPPA